MLNRPHNHACQHCHAVCPTACTCPDPAAPDRCSDRLPGERSAECMSLPAKYYADLRHEFKLDEWTSTDLWRAAKLRERANGLDHSDYDTPDT